MITIKKILCPVDFSPASDMAVDYAANLAARYGAKMYLLHTVSLGIPAAYEYALNTPKLEALLDGEIRQCIGNLNPDIRLPVFVAAL